MLLNLNSWTHTEVSLQTFSTPVWDRALPPGTCHKRLACQSSAAGQRKQRNQTRYHHRRRRRATEDPETKWGGAGERWLPQLTGARGLWSVRTGTEELGATCAHRRPHGAGLAVPWTRPALSLCSRLELTCRTGWRQQSRKSNTPDVTFCPQQTNHPLLAGAEVADGFRLTGLCNESYKLR